MLPSILIMSLVLSAEPAEPSKPIPGIGPTGPMVKIRKPEFKSIEGPVYDGNGNLYFTESLLARIYKLDAKGEVSIWREKSNRARGLKLNGKGEIIACEYDGQVTALGSDGAQLRVLADKFEDKKFNAPNDLIIDQGGGIYFSDSKYGAPKVLPQGKTRVYYISAEGQLTSVINDLGNPNGLLLSLDEKTLYVTMDQKIVNAYPVMGPGKLGTPKTFCEIQQSGTKTNSGGGGMTMDTQGNVYIATRFGVQVFDPSGKMLGSITFQDKEEEFCKADNVTFGGPEWKTLYVTCRGILYVVPMEAKGYVYPAGKPK